VSWKGLVLGTRRQRPPHAAGKKKEFSVSNFSIEKSRIFLQQFKRTGVAMEVPDNSLIAELLDHQALIISEPGLVLQQQQQQERERKASKIIQQ